MKKAVVVICCLVMSAPLAAFIQPDRSEGPGTKAFEHSAAGVEMSLTPAGELIGSEGRLLRRDLAEIGVKNALGHLDTRGGRWGGLWLAEPMIPGSGKGNRLSWSDLGSVEATATDEVVWQRFVDFLDDHRDRLRIEPSELDGNVGIHDGGALIQIHGRRVVEGIPVRGVGVTATINHGNLILLGADLWGDLEVSRTPTLPAEAAMAELGRFLDPFVPDSFASEPRLEFLTLAAPEGHPAGKGYDYRLAWILSPRFEGAVENWEAAIDAHTGEPLRFEDTNHYGAVRNVKGGVFPVSNDGAAPDGVEVPGYPMPYVNVTHDGGTTTSDGGGNVFGATGTMSTTLTGPFLRITDGCGAVNESSADGDLDLLQGPGTDCDTPPGAMSAGNTHAARTGFYELGRLQEMARALLPSNTWLMGQLLARMNIAPVCNAFWSGSVDFYRSAGGCANTGELAGVFDHEWGHGMDDNGTNGSISNPGEGIPDIYAGLRLNQSCMGRGLFLSGATCNGYGDPCISCTGVRDIDWEQRQSQMPHDRTWASSNCGSSHCRGAVYSEAVWDLWKRDLPSIYGFGGNTNHEIVTRLTFLGADNVSSWYNSSLGQEGGCASSSGYQQFLGADDDNGDLTDGTPHMAAIAQAFARHDIDCSTPTLQDSGCVDRPTVAPVATIAALDMGASLSWDPVANATRYKIYRTDGEFACDFGKALMGTTTETTFDDGGLQNGREYYYIVAGFNDADSCMGPASSCLAVTAGEMVLFADGFESGDTTAWSTAAP